MRTPPVGLSADAGTHVDRQFLGGAHVRRRNRELPRAFGAVHGQPVNRQPLIAGAAAVHDEALLDVPESAADVLGAAEAGADVTPGIRTARLNWLRPVGMASMTSLFSTLCLAELWMSTAGPLR